VRSAFAELMMKGQEASSASRASSPKLGKVMKAVQLMLAREGYTMVGLAATRRRIRSLCLPVSGL
jgi:hypothetical protein